MAENVPDDFRGFMAYYDSVHQNGLNRLFHAIAFTQGIVGLALVFALRPLWWIGIVVGLLSYAWAWTGHFAFEKNKPATFHSPVKSLVYGFVWFFFLAITLGRGVRWAQQTSSA
jgi:hypothetical protein